MDFKTMDLYTVYSVMYYILHVVFEICLKNDFIRIPIFFGRFGIRRILKINLNVYDLYLLNTVH